MRSIAIDPHERLLGTQDTITGFLLAGVGNIDLRRKSNFLVVDSSVLTRLLLGFDVPARGRELTSASPRAETSTKTIEETFKDFTNRDDIAVVMINQYVSSSSPPLPRFCPISVLVILLRCRRVADCGHDSPPRRPIQQGAPNVSFFLRPSSLRLGARPDGTPSSSLRSPSPPFSRSPARTGHTTPPRRGAHKYNDESSAEPPPAEFELTSCPHLAGFHPEACPEPPGRGEHGIEREAVGVVGKLGRLRLQWVAGRPVRTDASGLNATELKHRRTFLAFARLLSIVHCRCGWSFDSCGANHLMLVLQELDRQAACNPMQLLTTSFRASRFRLEAGTIYRRGPLLLTPQMKHKWRSGFVHASAGRFFSSCTADHARRRKPTDPLRCWVSRRITSLTRAPH